MRYAVQIKDQAVDDLKYLLRNEPKAYKKALQLIGELYAHPSTARGIQNLSAVSELNVGADASRRSTVSYMTFMPRKLWLWC